MIRPEPRRIVLTIPSLGAGGAERVLTTMANNWAGKGWEVMVLTLKQGDRAPAFALDPRVRRHDAQGIVRSPTASSISRAAGFRPGPLRHLFRGPRVLRLRSALVGAAPEAVLSFTSRLNALVVLACLGTGLPVIVSERRDPRVARPDEDPASWWWWRRLWPWLYPRAAFVVAQTEDALAFFARRSGIRGRVIPNPVSPPPGEPPPRREPGGVPARVLAAMGSLRAVKQFHLLVEAFHRIAGANPDWRLVIWGEGPLRADLDRRVARLRLESRVRLAGFTPEPCQALREADLFAVTSLTEGFPNALCDAMACGLPAVCFDGPGTRAVVREGVDGTLVPPGDVAGLAEALDRLMRDATLRARYAVRAVEVLQRFSVERVMAEWESLLDAASGGRHR